MGEELALTSRAYTNGYDVYAPNRTLLTHEYVRKHLPKFWEMTNRVFNNGWAHNNLDYFVVKRTKHMTGYEANDRNMSAAALDADDPNLRFGLDGKYGLGKTRSLEAFLDHVKVNMKDKTVGAPGYCTMTWPSD